MDVEDRKEDADPHGRAADELVVLDAGHFDDRPVGGRDHQPWLLRDAARRIAKEIDDQGQRHGGQYCQPPVKISSRNRHRHQRPAHQLQLGQPPAGKRNPAPPAKRIVGLLPGAGAAIAAVFQVAGIEDFVRAPRAIAAAQFGHAADVAGPKPRQPPSPPAAPGQLDPAAHPAARLYAADVLRERLRGGAVGEVSAGVMAISR